MTWACGCVRISERQLDLIKRGNMVRSSVVLAVVLSSMAVACGDPDSSVGALESAVVAASAGETDPSAACPQVDLAASDGGVEGGEDDISCHHTTQGRAL